MARKSRAHRLKRAKEYYERSYPKNGIPPVAARDRGAAGEHFVISELLRRGLFVGGPYNQNGSHDLFVKASGCWRTVQVKIAWVNQITKAIHKRNCSRRGGIVSDLLALVDLEGKRIRWVSTTDEPVPDELL